MNTHEKGLTNRRYKCLNNLYTKSKYEAIFMNFLHINNIQFEYEGKISEKSNHTYDFKVINKLGERIYIEIWGMMNFDNYTKTRIVKEQLYRSEGKNLISLEKKLFLKNINSINSYLVEIFIDKKIKTDNFSNKVNDLLVCEEYKLSKTYRVKFISPWGDEENVENELIKIIDTLNGVFPAYLDLPSSFRKIVSKRGVIYWMKKLGFETNLKEDGYWTLENILSEIEPIIKETGRFPNGIDLNPALLSAFKKHIGGVANYAKEQGYIITLEKHNGYWKPESAKIKVFNELNIICKKLVKFPCMRWFRDNHYHIHNYLCAYHNDYSEFAIILGFDPKTRKRIDD